MYILAREYTYNKMQLYLSDTKILDRIKKELNKSYDFVKYYECGILSVNTEQLYKTFLKHIKILLDHVLNNDYSDFSYLITTHTSRNTLLNIKDVLRMYLKDSFNTFNICQTIEDLICANILSEFMCDDVVDIVMEYDKD